MLEKNIRRISMVLIFTMIISLGSVSFGDKVKELKNEQEGIKNELKTTQEKLKSKQRESKTVEEQIDELDRNMNKASIELSKVEDELTGIENNIAKNEKELKIAEDILLEKQENFEARLRVMYMNGNVGYLELFLTSKDIKDFFSRKDMVQAIAEQDKELLLVMKEQKEIIEEAKKVLESQRASLSAAKTKLESRRKDLEIATREKETLMSRLQEDVESYEKQYDDLNNFAVEVEGKILKLQEEQRAKEAAKAAAEAAKNNQSGNNVSSNSGSSSSGTSSSAPTGGKMTWPVPSSGRVSSYFGYRIHPIFHTKKLHTGIDIPASSGSNVVAASSGVVIHSGWLGGYGNTVMVDHGGGIVTLYAHNSSTVVGTGQSVSTGSVIAKVGSTGNSTGPHSHFEVRKNGKYIDPLPWVR